MWVPLGEAVSVFLEWSRLVAWATNACRWTSASQGWRYEMHAWKEYAGSCILLWVIKQIRLKKKRTHQIITCRPKYQNYVLSLSADLLLHPETLTSASLNSKYVPFAFALHAFFCSPFAIGEFAYCCVALYSGLLNAGCMVYFPFRQEAGRVRGKP